MKKILKSITLAAVLAVVSMSVHAQKKNENSADCVSAKGYWVVQSNINAPDKHTVYFYDRDNTLVATREFTGKQFNPSKRKTKMELKKALENALTPAQGMGEGDQPMSITMLY